MRRVARSMGVLFVLGGSVLAYQGPPAPPPQAGKPGDVDVTFEQESKMTPQQMLDLGQTNLGKMQDGLRRVVQLQELARKQNDVIKLNCVNDKHVQVKAAINIGEQAMTDLHESIARGDDGGRIHSHTKVSLAHQKVQVLVNEAENCVGQDLSFVGATQVQVDVDPGIPQNDPTGVSFPVPSLDRPPEASPFI